jgi:hypothetical protein
VAIATELQLGPPNLKQKEGYAKTMTPAKKHPTKTAAKKQSTKALTGRHHPDGPRKHPHEFDIDLRVFTDMEQLTELLKPLLQKAIKASEEAKHHPLKVVPPYHNITYCRH